MVWIFYSLMLKYNCSVLYRPKESKGIQIFFFFFGYFSLYKVTNSRATICDARQQNFVTIGNITDIKNVNPFLEWGHRVTLTFHSLR